MFTSTNTSSQNILLKEELARHNVQPSIRDRYKSGIYESIISKYRKHTSSENKSNNVQNNLRQNKNSILTSKSK